MKASGRFLNLPSPQLYFVQIVQEENTSKQYKVWFEVGILCSDHSIDSAS